MDPEDYISATRSRFGCEWPDGNPEFRSGSVNALARHWIELSASVDGAVPYRHQIDPTLIGQTLSQVYIYERDEAGFVCRLAGERVSWNHDARLKGRRLAEILDGPVHEMVSLFMMTCLVVPAVYRNIGLLYSDAAKREVMGERVFLPLRDDDGGVESLIGMTDIDTLRAVSGRAMCRCRCDRLAASSGRPEPSSDPDTHNPKLGGMGKVDYSRSISRMVM